MFWQRIADIQMNNSIAVPHVVYP